MKIIKVFISFIVLVTLGSVTSVAEEEINKYGYNKLIDTFEMIDAKFEFYNIKISSKLKEGFKLDDLEKIGIEVISTLGVDKKNINIETKWDGTKKQTVISIKDIKDNIIVKVIRKDNEQSYVIVDIIERDVYKNIVDKYTLATKVVEKYSNEVDTNICLCGKYDKNIYFNKNDEIFQKVLYNMNAKEISKIQDKNFISMTAYSRNIEKSINVMKENINLNIAMRYSDKENTTYIYIATPIIKLDY